MAFLLIATRGVADDIVETFIPSDSSPDNSFYVAMAQVEKDETFWQQLLPPMADNFFYKDKAVQSPMAFNFITWGDLALFFTSISVAGGEEAHDFLNSISSETASFISRQEDGTYVAQEGIASQAAELASSSNIFSKYSEWRNKHYQLYKMLLVQKEKNDFNVDLLEKQMKEIGMVGRTDVDGMATGDLLEEPYHLATPQEFIDFCQACHAEIKVLPPEKNYGLLMVDTQIVGSQTVSQRLTSEPMPTPEYRDETPIQSHIRANKIATEATGMLIVGLLEGLSVRLTHLASTPETYELAAAFIFVGMCMYIHSRTIDIQQNY